MRICTCIYSYNIYGYNNCYYGEYNPSEIDISFTDYMMAQQDYIINGYHNITYHKYAYCINSANALLYENYNYALDIKSLEKADKQSLQQQRTGILRKAPKENATNAEKDQYKYDVIDYIIEQNMKKGMHPSYMHKLKVILVKYKDIIPTWEYDIGTYRGKKGDGKLDQYDQLFIEMKIPGTSKFLKNYPFMNTPQIQREITRLIEGWIAAGIAREVDLTN